MHRTEGEDHIIEDGKRRYTQAIPPTQAATRLPAEAMNSIQEEIANVIEKAGLTLSASASADRTAGWEQLYKAIFESGKLTGAAIAANAITQAKMADNSVGTNELIDDAITGDKVIDRTLTLQSQAFNSTLGQIVYSNANITQDEVITLTIPARCTLMIKATIAPGIAASNIQTWFTPPGFPNVITGSTSYWNCSALGSGNKTTVTNFSGIISSGPGETIQQDLHIDGIVVDSTDKLENLYVIAIPQS